MTSLGRGIATGVGAVAGVGAACVAYGSLVELGDFRLRRAEVPALPAGSPSLRLLHVSDIHARPGRPRELAFVRSLGALAPDLVVNTGDNLSSSRAVEPLAEALTPLLGVPGGVVFGSNDFYGPLPKNPLGYLTGRHTQRRPQDLPADQLRDRLTAGAWRWLEGRRERFDVGGVVVEMRGTGDAHIDRDDWSLVAGPRQPGVDVVIGVTHAPYLRAVEAVAADDVDLLLCGHTHGGQVCVPTPGGRTEGRALTTNCDLPPEQVKGLSRVPRAGRDDLLLHVSAGLGTSPFAPYRFACPPEVTLLTLVARA